MTKHQAYPEYKKSGIEWLGNVPEHWKLGQLKTGYTVKLGKMLQQEQKDEGDTLLPYMRASNIQPSGVDVSEIKKMWFTKDEVKSIKLLHGDLLVSEGGDAGRCATWSAELKECGYQNAINRVRAKNNNNNVFLKYLIQNIKKSGAIDAICNRLSIAHFTAEKLKSLDIVLPPTEEQEAIATFLDNEAARIDTLIKKKIRFIELLKEKREALISHAVTKGLNPDAEMKDSGIEWFGEVPKHWLVTQLKRGFTVKLGKMLQPQMKGENDILLPYIRASNIQPYGVTVSNIKKMWFSESELISLKLISGDLLVSEGGDVGRCALWGDELPECGYQNAVNRVRGINGNSNVFLKYLIQGIKENGVIDVICNKLSIAHFTAEKLQALCIVIPPSNEQAEIANHLTQQDRKIELLTNKTLKSIALLKEHRTALISAAVTGKIDVRNHTKNKKNK